MKTSSNHADPMLLFIQFLAVLLLFLAGCFINYLEAVNNI